MLGSGLKAEIRRFCLMLLAVCLLGIWTGKLTALLILGLCGYTIWLFVRIHRLERWIYQTRRGNTPPAHAPGQIWEDIVYDVQLILARHDKEKQRLQAVVSRVREMTQALNDAVILIDKRGDIEWWNLAAEQLFDFREVDRGHKLANLIRHPNFIEYYDAREYEQPLELTLWRKNMQLEFHVHVFGGGERLVIARDITRLFKLEQMRKDFVANVSHELRTPLTVIRGYVETLSDSAEVPKAWARAFAQMEQQCKRMTLLIDDLISLSKLETDQKETFKTPLKVAPLLADIVKDARATAAGKDIRFSLDGDADLAIIGNERELRSAFSNLLINAVKYSSAGAQIRILYQRQPTGAVISVADNGPGIEPKHLPRLTERFYRVDSGRSSEAGGTGLGLAIVKHVLLRHNAELTISSQLGVGSEFSCHFPLTMVAQAG